MKKSRDSKKTHQWGQGLYCNTTSLGRSVWNLIGRWTGLEQTGRDRDCRQVRPLSCAQAGTFNEQGHRWILSNATGWSGEDCVNSTLVLALWVMFSLFLSNPPLWLLQVSPALALSCVFQVIAHGSQGVCIRACHEQSTAMSRGLVYNPNPVSEAKWTERGVKNLFNGDVKKMSLKNWTLKISHYLFRCLPLGPFLHVCINRQSDMLFIFIFFT